MRTFDLQAALNGELVQLRNGCRARIVYVHDAGLKDVYGNELKHILISFIITKDDKVLRGAEAWTLEGKVSHLSDEDPYDIVGMHEKPSRLEVLAEAWERGMLVRSTETGAKYKVIAKTKDDDYVLESVDRGWMSRLKHTDFELVEEYKSKE